jgi:hypothetical protein
MRKTVAVLALTVALSIVLAASTLVPAISQPPPDRVTLTWFDPRATDFEKELNFGGKGFGPGDMGLVKDSIFDPETCEKAGTVLIRFQFVKAAGRNDGFFIDDGGLLLPDGKLTFQLIGRFTEFESETGAAVAVTGGTGAYRDATGQAFVSEDHRMCDKRGALITADLVLE